MTIYFLPAAFAFGEVTSLSHCSFVVPTTATRKVSSLSVISLPCRFVHSWCRRPPGKFLRFQSNIPWPHRKVLLGAPFTSECGAFFCSDDGQSKQVPTSKYQFWPQAKRIWRCCMVPIFFTLIMPAPNVVFSFFSHDRSRSFA